MMGIALFVAVAVLCLVVVLFSLHYRRLKIPLSLRPLIQKEWEHACAMEDPEKRLMEAEKVLHHAFRVMGLPGSFGDILKLKGARFPNLQSLWTAHKLRNRLAHEPGFHPSKQDLENALSAFGRTLQELV